MWIWIEDIKRIQENRKFPKKREEKICSRKMEFEDSESEEYGEMEEKELFDGNELHDSDTVHTDV